MKCECCGQTVHKPNANVVIVSRNLPNYQATILETVWSGKGQPVLPERIIQAIYEDRPMPEKNDPREALKLGIHRLRKNLLGTGVAIESAGYGRGFQLKIINQETQP